MYDLALKAGYDRPALLYNNIGYSYLMLGQLDDAEKWLQRAIRSLTAIYRPPTITW